MGQFFEKAYDEMMEIKENSIKESFEKPKVSIIVPAYNTEKYIYKCLLSLISQTLKEIEIIIINDGSTDSTPFIIKKFSDVDGRIKVITQSNQKQGAARNRGTEIATGEYIGFVDSDDWVDLDYYEKLYNSAKKYDSDIALATNVRIGNGKTKKRLNIKKEQFVTSLQDKIDISNQVKNPCPTNKIYRRDMIFANKITWPEGVYCEDKLFTIKAIYYANGLVTVPDIYYYYFRNPNSTVNTKAKKRLLRYCDDRNKAKKDVLSFLIEKNAEIRDKEFWATIDECKFFGFSWLQKRISLNTKQISILGIPIFTIEENDDFRTQNFLFNLLYTKKTKSDIIEEKIFKFCGIVFSRRYIKDDICEYYFLGSLLNKFHLADFLYNKYLKKVDYTYDDVYLLHSNSGEIFLFFAYICEAFLNKNNSKKPLFIATKKYHVDILKMYYPNANYIFIDNLKFKTQSDKWTKYGHNIYLIFSGNHFDKVELDIKNNKLGTVHYLNNILTTLELEIKEYKTAKPIITKETVDLVDKKIKQLGLKKENFIILAPEAKTCEELPLSFWNELAQQLKNLNYDIFINITDSKNTIRDCKQTALEYQEVFYLAQQAKAIISLRSGLTEFLLPTQTPSISIYTKFRKRNKRKAVSVDKTMSGFTMKKIPNILKQNITEINIDNYTSIQELITQVIDMLNKTLNGGVK